MERPKLTVVSAHSCILRPSVSAISSSSAALPDTLHADLTKYKHRALGTLALFHCSTIEITPQSLPTRLSQALLLKAQGLRRGYFLLFLRDGYCHLSYRVLLYLLIGEFKSSLILILPLESLAEHCRRRCVRRLESPRFQGRFDTCVSSRPPCSHACRILTTSSLFPSINNKERRYYSKLAIGRM